MTFFIQASNPTVVPVLELTETDLREAIEDIFISDTEDAILNWNGVSIALSYKYDISVMMADLIEMISAIKASDSGEHIVHWPSDTFQAEWALNWDENEIVCLAEWQNVSGNIEKILTHMGMIKLSKKGFLNEWKAPLERVLDGLRLCGYHANSLREFRLLENLVAQLEGPGKLYTEIKRRNTSDSPKPTAP